VADLTPVPAPEVEDKWHFAEPWVRSAVEEGALVETVESYKARCLDRSAQLWLIRDHDQVSGAAVTEIYPTPKGLTCAVPVVGAVSLNDALVPVFEEIERWARAEGCVRLEGFGRQGWVRALKPYGWRPLSVVIEKDI
jgi:hypothetical protein